METALGDAAEVCARPCRMELKTWVRGMRGLVFGVRVFLIVGGIGLARQKVGIMERQELGLLGGATETRRSEPL